MDYSIDSESTDSSHLKDDIWDERFDRGLLLWTTESLFMAKSIQLLLFWRRLNPFNYAFELFVYGFIKVNGLSLLGTTGFIKLWTDMKMIKGMEKAACIMN